MNGLTTQSQRGGGSGWDQRKIQEYPSFLLASLYRLPVSSNPQFFSQEEKFHSRSLFVLFHPDFHSSNLFLNSGRRHLKFSSLFPPLLRGAGVTCENLYCLCIRLPDLNALEIRDSDGALNRFFDLSHESGADRSGKRTANQKGFIQSCHLFALGHGSFFETPLSGG